ncbi:LLM class flavin-dependent oxidoreductase [Thioalkalivibrio sp. HK1]|uniref:LLM class flavin-dependent oxidoreductase n=1 Tax=Thioalkalivibrio sp. HK1 TaxID=1469245 RepID=UPI00046FD72E|nr:LLM class flavin-dependent oxidoreductase [Thioalkalivibrio sp. HK1]
MNLGLFMQPVHPPWRDIGEALEEDRQAIMLADRLAFTECWIGEHFTAVTEPISSPLMFCATLVHRTRQIRFGCGVLALPAQHPVVVASQAALFDHLSGGRFLMGVGPGTLSSDVEVFGVDDIVCRSKMMAESLDIILRLWTDKAPFEFDGEFFPFSLQDLSRHRFGVGALVKPLQKPHPPVALSLTAPGSFSAGVCGERGFIPVSANFIHSRHVASHWTTYREGCERAGRRPDPAVWRIARSIFVSDDESLASDRVADPQGVFAWYYEYLLSGFRRRGAVFLVKESDEVADEAITPVGIAESLVIAGTPDRVLDRLIAFREEVGDFGTLLDVAHDWQDPVLGKRSMQLLAEEVMPRFRRHCQAIRRPI